MTPTLRPYQQKANDRIVELYTKGYNKIVFQLATGGGKTKTAASLIHRYIQKSEKKVLFVVHRDELLTQFRNTMVRDYNIEPQSIKAGARHRNPRAQIYATMVETANNRLGKSSKWYGDVGLVIIDECHIASFNKIHKYFPDSLIVGLTATPQTASKKHPLNEFYQEIVCGVDISELIDDGFLVPNITYHIKNINRDSIKITRGEFDTTALFNEYSKGKNIDNCVNAYEEKAKGKKTIVFNCNIEHSELVNQAFIDRGYNSKHLDGATNKEERKNILKWFADTPGAILQNVGVLTAGFDEPSTECVIMNRATESLPLWVQCTGRASRPFPDKENFIILDLGSNALAHGDWSDIRDWHYMFHNPNKPKDSQGVAPSKNCPECDAIIATSATACKYCGYEFPAKEIKYDKDNIELVLFSSKIKTKETLTHIKQQGSNSYAALHIIKGNIIKQYREQSSEINDTIAYNLLEMYLEKVAEWCKLEGKRYDDWHKKTTAQWFFEELERQFNWERPKLNGIFS